MPHDVPPWAERYLKRLGLEAEAPSYDYLSRLIRARLTALAFENISKMHYFRRYPEHGWYIPDPDTYAEDVHRRDFGGLCHVGNGLFQLLLAALGYDCHSVTVGGAGPDRHTHLGTTVFLDGRRLYVDVAVGHPTYAPIDITADTQFVACGSTVHFYPGEDNPAVFHMDVTSAGTQRQWIMDPFEPVTLQTIDAEIRTSNQPGRVFTSILCCRLWQPEQARLLSLVNRSFTIHHADGRVDKRVLDTVHDFEDVLGSEYGLPRLPVGEAIEVLGSAFGVKVLGPAAGRVDA